MPIRRVPLNDEIGLLDQQTATEVKRISQLLYRDLKSEMAVLIIRSTEGKNASDYALEIFNNWTLGQTGVDNGMLIMFAIDDHRVEIKPGIRYKGKFTDSFCTSLLTRHVVPEMKANRPAQGVLVAAREVAAEIRRCEGVDIGTSNNTSPGEAPISGSNSSTNVSGSSGSSSSNSVTSSSGSSNSYSSSSSGRSNPKNLLKHPALRIALFIVIGLWVAGGVFYFIRAFNHGQLIMSPWIFIILMFLSGIIIAMLVSQAFNMTDSPLDQVFAGTGGASFLGFMWCFSHICPRCNKYMMVHNRTLHSPTYYSSGLGEKTVHCENCGYHNVSTYTIARRTRSSSSSSSSSSSGGGGRSSGGGGGASW